MFGKIPKSILTLCIHLSALTCYSSTQTENDPKTPFNGDVDNNGKVDIMDLVRTIKLVNLNKYYVTFDVNEDNKVDQIDVSLVADLIINEDRTSMTTYNWQEFVDLGLPSGRKWAKMNVGATSPEQSGDFFAWGETTPKTSYTWASYVHCNGTEYTITKYCTSRSDGTVDNKTTLELEDDAAHVYMGGKWRMPTISEQQELLDNCYWLWTTNYNNTQKAGFIVYKPKRKSDIGKHVTDKLVPSSGYSISDAHIFLPSAGYKEGENLLKDGILGRYWTSSLNTEESSRSCSLYSISYSLYTSEEGKRYYGRNIRGVH